MRVAERGDLFAPVAELEQELPVAFLRDLNTWVRDKLPSSCGLLTKALAM